MYKSFVILTHNVCIILNINNQKIIIKRLIKNNAKLHEDLKILRIVWFKKIVESEKIHSSFIVKIRIKTIMNQLLNINMLNLYQKCLCKLFEKNCYVIQCFNYFNFNYMIKFCKNDKRCFKYINKHYIEICIVSMNKRYCMNCNNNQWTLKIFMLQVKITNKTFRRNLLKQID